MSLWRQTASSKIRPGIGVLRADNPKHHLGEEPSKQQGLEESTAGLWVPLMRTVPTGGLTE